MITRTHTHTHTSTCTTAQTDMCGRKKKFSIIWFFSLLWWLLLHHVKEPSMLEFPSIQITVKTTTTTMLAYEAHTLRTPLHMYVRIMLLKSQRARTRSGMVVCGEGVKRTRPAWRPQKCDTHCFHWKPRCEKICFTKTLQLETQEPRRTKEREREWYLSDVHRSCLAEVVPICSPAGQTTARVARSASYLVSIVSV